MISFLLTVHIWAEPSVIYDIDGKSNGFSWMMSPYIYHVTTHLEPESIIL